ncbi:MAG: topoisomerase IV [Defluviitaleaceae bacterium]|nr:topoisomerase IV [Defluviitaleaceae bacterium]MCL2262978.1 topoisomerase IV [Defluviitaleaceae bacterium]
MPENHIIEQPITNALELNYMPYAMSVIVSRAIPEIDGFKPAHRKLLYTMYKMGLLSREGGGRRIKSADIVGQTMRLNPHGDGPIYETMVRLTRGNDALLHPLIDSKGNFGKQFSRDMAYAASRYTEAKLDDICREVFRDIDKNVVDMVDNYNATMLEPVLLPTTFPNLLVTPNQGIAVGMASTVCSFNLKEVCETTIKWLKNPKHDITKTLLAPDFSTGGELIFNPDEMANIYATGRGSFKMRARYRHDEKNSCIEVYEIPYTTTIEAIMDKIVALVKAGKIRDINDVRDETDLQGLKITIDIKKSANAENLMQRLFQLTPLRESFNCNFNFLINGRPRVMGITEILQEWTAFRIGCIKRQLAFDIAKKSDKLHLLEGLAKIILDIDKAIKIIRETPKESEVIANLMKGFTITQPQAEFIAEIKLRHLNREYLQNRISERKALEDELAELKATHGSEEKIRGVISAQLKEIAKKYGAPRRTEIVDAEEAPILPVETFIDDYNLKLFLTDQNYIKKVSLVSLRSADTQYLKDDDFITQELEATNRDELLLFTNQHNVYKTKIHELPDCKASALGEYLTNILDMAEGERVLYLVLAKDYGGFMLFGFANGKIAKVKLDAYATKTNRKKLVNAYSDKAPLVDMYHAPEDIDLFLMRGKDKAMVVNSSLVPLNSSKSSGGVSVFTLRKNTLLTEMRPLADTDDPDYYRADKIPTAGHFLQKQLTI